VGKDNIDASIGLAFSLTLFERYRKTGLMQAEIHHVPGIRGRCKGYLHLVEGKVVSCYIEDKEGQRQSIGKDILIKVDKDRGPFEWSLAPLPAPPSETPAATQMSTNPHLAQNAPVPRTIATLELEKLEGWTSKQKLMLSMVYETVDGQRTIDQIKLEAPLPPDVTEEALRILFALKVITIVP
jgi:hypothetical protein